jgi:methyl-accepting chemotaxis protein
LKEKYEYYINIQNKINLSISKCSKKYKNFNITLKELNELKKEFSILEYVDNNEISENLLTIKLEIKSLNKQIKDINDSNISSICPLCGSNISKDQISSHINSINEKLKEKNNKVKKLENEINEININNEKYSNKHQEVINVEKKYLETKQYEK